MVAVDFLHHENPPTWSGVESATLGTEGQRQTNYATQPAIRHICDRGSLAVKVTDSWLVYHKFKPALLKTRCVEDRCMLSMLRLKRPPIGVVRELGEVAPA
ncbi:hypothetical protein TNCV_171011 [Trichonephila clavipes]|nr:hypothetical protein TNCV_171011 [Trichonephila clavipes]